MCIVLNFFFGEKCICILDFRELWKLNLYFQFFGNCYNILELGFSKNDMDFSFKYINDNNNKKNKKLIIIK